MNECKEISIEKLVKIINIISDNIDFNKSLKINTAFEFDIKEINEKLLIDFSKIISIQEKKFKSNNLFKTWGELRKKSDKYEIYLNQDIKYFPKQIFTLAHEYVHFIIDQILQSNIKIKHFDFLKLENGNSFNRSEERYEYIIEALSSKLIVSDEKFSKFIAGKNFSHSLIIDISKEFNLSLSAAEIRYEETQ